MNHEQWRGCSASRLPLLVAEEVGANWRRVCREQSATDPAYAHPQMHQQLTGGSLTTVAQYQPQRKAGPAVRAALLQAAAKRWNVDVASLRIDTGKVIHAASKRSATYGELAAEAADIAPPANPPLKDPKDFRLIGKPLRRLDAATKVDGSAKFGMDMQLPGMLRALIAPPPLLAFLAPLESRLTRGSRECVYVTTSTRNTEFSSVAIARRRAIEPARPFDVAVPLAAVADPLRSVGAVQFSPAAAR